VEGLLGWKEFCGLRKQTTFGDCASIEEEKNKE
jgi:hypothetical protein